jgi:hypothetical protein
MAALVRMKAARAAEVPKPTTTRVTLEVTNTTEAKAAGCARERRELTFFLSTCLPSEQ